METQKKDEQKKDEQKTKSDGILITYYYYDKRGRRIELGTDYDNSLKKFKRIIKRIRKNVMLYGEYVTGQNYHIISVCYAIYHYEKDLLIYIKRNEL